MKHRFLSTLFILVLLISMIPAAAASGSVFTVVNETKRLNSARVYSAEANNAEEVIKVLDGTISPPPKQIFGKGSALDTTAPVVIKMLNTDSTTFDKELSVENRICRISLTSSVNKSNTHYTHNVTLSGRITVGNGGTLILAGSDQASSSNGHAKVTVDPAIEVNQGGTLYIECNPTADANDTYTSASGDSIIKVNGGTLHLGAADFVMPEQSTVPAILVESGNVVVHERTAGFYLQDGSTLIPNYDAKNPYGDSTSITTSGVPAIEVKSGCSLTIEGGTFSATGNSPAITVAENANLVIPTESTATVTTGAANGQAIDLADGSTIQKGDTAITVGTNAADDATADNYVDNNGNIILAAGAEKDGEILNAAVILTNGTVVQGSQTEAPTLQTTTDADGNTITTVTVPAGGSVQKPDEDKQELANGGTVTSTATDTSVTENTVDVSSVTLNQTSLSLFTNKDPKTAQLTATVKPDNATNKAVTWSSSNENVATVDKDGKVTAVGNGTATITATAGGKSETCTVNVSTYTASVVSNPITVPSVTGGKVAVSPDKAAKGDTVTLTVTPDKGYQLSSLTVTDGSGNKVQLTDKGNGTYTFTMPDSKVKVNASFSKIVVKDPVKDCPQDKTCPAVAFSDVPAKQWYHDGVHYCVANKLMVGIGDNMFAPNTNLSRAMLVSVLYRMDGSPAVGAPTFADVPANQWYSKAVAWAAEKKIVAGIGNNLYAPDQDITRQDMSAILYRYAQYKGADMKQLNDLTAFGDAGSISSYAKAPVQWCVAHGIISGKPGKVLDPKGNASRAEVATVLYRYCESVTK